MKYFLFFLLFVLTASAVNAQATKTISGYVRDANAQPIPYAYILLNHHKFFAGSTNKDGYYQIRVDANDEGDTIKCTHLNYQTEAEKIEGNSIINFYLHKAEQKENNISIKLPYKKNEDELFTKENNDEDGGCRDYTVVMIPSTFSTQKENLNDFFINRISFPDSINSSSSKRVIKINLAIDKKGLVSKVILLKGINDFLNSKVIEIALKTKWLPAVVNWRTIESAQDISLTFQ